MWVCMCGVCGMCVASMCLVYVECLHGVFMVRVCSTSLAYRNAGEVLCRRAWPLTGDHVTEENLSPVVTIKDLYLLREDQVSRVPPSP